MTSSTALPRAVLIEGYIPRTDVFGEKKQPTTLDSSAFISSFRRSSPGCASSTVDRTGLTWMARAWTPTYLSHPHQNSMRPLKFYTQIRSQRSWLKLGCHGNVQKSRYSLLCCKFLWLLDSLQQTCSLTKVPNFLWNKILSKALVQGEPH